MRLVTYARNEHTGIGVRLPDGVAPIEGYATMLDLIRSGQEGLDAAAGRRIPRSVIGPGEPIVLPTAETQVDPEDEMALIIGKTAKRVKRTEALSYAFGYTVVNDVGAHDIQFQDNQEDRGKGYDTFTPMGPDIVLTDELPEPQASTLKLYVNDEERQSDTTAHMHWSFAATMESISAHIALYPGDIITSGTPSGIGYFRTQPVFLNHGDVVTVEVGGVGRLTNPVIAGW